MRLLSIAACLSVLVAVSASATSARALSPARRATPLEAAIAREVNATRAERGLSTLARSGGLTRAADTHTLAMFETGRFDHDLKGFPTFSQRIRRYYASGTQSWNGGENLALFGGSTPTAADVVALWLQSPPHRAILLDRTWRELGVAVRFSDQPTGDFAGQPTWLITLDLGRRS